MHVNPRDRRAGFLTAAAPVWKSINFYALLWQKQHVWVLTLGFHIIGHAKFSGCSHLNPLLSHCGMTQCLCSAEVQTAGVIIVAIVYVNPISTMRYVTAWRMESESWPLVDAFHPLSPLTIFSMPCFTTSSHGHPLHYHFPTYSRTHNVYFVMQSFACACWYCLSLCCSFSHGHVTSQWMTPMW